RRRPPARLESAAFGVAVGATVLASPGAWGPSGALARLARDADLFVCEATLLNGEPDPRGHLSLREAQDAFAASGAKRLLVTHRPQERPLPGGIESASDGLELDF